MFNPCCYYNKPMNHISTNRIRLRSDHLRLKEAEEARTLCVSIEGLECSKDMVDALQLHANSMTNLFRELTKLTNQKIDSESAYASLFGQAETFSAWYKSRRKVANSMKLAAGSNAKAA